ncbi:MAG: hypothetical protein K2Q10_07140 [Rhodospirillales bacterium]|nr:hypothetical protein [Rhodospirillales bacterium]
MEGRRLRAVPLSSGRPAAVNDNRPPALFRLKQAIFLTFLAALAAAYVWLRQSA